ncbi:MBL fold metallo-hydrolase [Candidatus Bathyarchaeota archaeon]|nr:MBL fold metallo-hydrolase [Candidatus Bathyarchaeota archaeon]
MHVTVLGSAANGGIPQWDCCCLNCTAARNNQKLRRTRSSIAISLNAEEYVLVDAGPDLKFQLESVGLIPKLNEAGPNFRQSRINAVLLTHGHGDHTVGVAEFSTGKSFNIPVYGPSDLIELLFGVNGRLNYFGELGRLAKDYVKPRILTENEEFFLLDGLKVEGFPIDHTDKLSDGQYYPSRTFGFEFMIDGKRLVYTPDLGKLSDSLVKKLNGVDVFFMDATFWWNNELDRVSGIKKTSYDLGHVPVEESMEILKSIDIGQIIYTHINHTNSLADPNSIYSKKVKENGFKLAYDGMTFTI